MAKKKTKTVLEPTGSYIEITKNEKCKIKGCDDYATKNMCRIGMCKKHYDEAID